LANEPRRHLKFLFWRIKIKDLVKDLQLGLDTKVMEGMHFEGEVVVLGQGREQRVATEVRAEGHEQVLEVPMRQIPFYLRE
jgi:hypothetical protein